MKTSTELKHTLHWIDGKGYKAYKDIQSSYQFTEFELHLDHVQGDPYAAPSALRVRLKRGNAAIPDSALASPDRILATEDYLTRLFAQNVARISRGVRGTGSSGSISIQHTGQEILKRSSCVLSDDYLEFRFYASLPARGRTILGSVAEQMLLREIPDIVKLSSGFDATIARQLILHVHIYEDYRAIQDALTPLKLVAFIPFGAVLPRRSGIDERPMTDREGPIVPFRSPDTMEVQIQTPNSGPISGMGIPEGVTIIAGGGFHGKSTLLNAVERSVYGHIPMDGRERVATIPDAMKIRSEDGRSIFEVDISGFIRDLPFDKDTRLFSSENASGSTSQAASIVEALEMGSRLLLIDEDTSATNFMIRDARMRELVRKEPITPLIDVIRSLYKDYGVSSIIVTGGAGDYFDVADTVIVMEDYVPEDATARIRSDTTQYNKPFDSWPASRRNMQLPSPLKGQREKFVARDRTTIQIGDTSIDMDALEQIAEHAQTEGVAFLLKQYYEAGKESRKSMVDLVFQIHDRFHSNGFAFIKRGNLAVPRREDLAATINRIRGLQRPDQS